MRSCLQARCCFVRTLHAFGNLPMKQRLVRFKALHLHGRIHFSVPSVLQISTLLVNCLPPSLSLSSLRRVCFCCPPSLFLASEEVCFASTSLLQGIRADLAFLNADFNPAFQPLHSMYEAPPQCFHVLYVRKNPFRSTSPGFVRWKINITS